MRPADLPAVDDHVVVPETGTEMIHGKIQKVLPAMPPHAEEQARIAQVIGSNVAPGYATATELLTRVDHDNDFATDACIYKLGRDPETGSRHLEELSFEVKNTQSNADIEDRARMLIRRGVRRVFAIHVREDEDGVSHAGPVKEWLASENRWQELHPEAEIVDRCLTQPIKVQALVDAAEAKNQAARALVHENNPVIAEHRRQALEAQERALSEAHARELEVREKALSAAHARELEAREKALSEAHETKMQEQARRGVLDLCDVLAIEVTAARRALVDSMTSAELDALRGMIRARRRWPEGS